jgi:hypothetical protein
MATIDGFNTKMVFGAAKLVDGRQYKVVLEDLKIKTKIVSYRKEWEGKKGLSGVEYDKLTPENKEIVDNAPIEYWEPKDGKEAQPKAKFEDRITFQFREPEEDEKRIYLQFKMKEGGWPTQKLREFVTKATAMQIDGSEGFMWGDIFKKGDEFVGIVKANGNMYTLEPDSVVKAELAPPIVKGDITTLSENAQKLYAFIKDNLNGSPRSEIAKSLKTGANGTIGPENDEKARYNATFAAWTEIRRSGIIPDGEIIKIE